MPIDDRTRKINILQPLSALIAALGSEVSYKLNSIIDTSGRLIVTEDAEITYLSLYWDRIDEALSVDIEKEAPRGGGFDETNTFDQKTHRIYPSFVAGAPTVAAQFEIQKLGYRATELPVGNSMTATFSSLSTIELEFTNEIIVASLDRTIRMEALPFGEILSLNTPTAGSGYLSSGSYFDESTEVGDYILSDGSGSDATVTVVANPTTVTVVTLVDYGRGFVIGGYYLAINNRDSNNIRASGLTIQVTAASSEGSISDFVISSGGTGYLVGDEFTIENGSIPATFTVDTISGGDITSVEISSGGIDYVADDVLTITPIIEFTVVDNATVEVLSAVTTNVDVEAEAPEVIEVTADEPKSNTVTVSISPATYSTTYRVTASRVLNLAKESSSLIALATTEAATPPCPDITSILFEAYGSGAQTIFPISYIAPFSAGGASHSNSEFLYYGTEGISWDEFIAQSEFTGANPEIVVPESVTPPDTVYAYYRDGAYLLPDSSWIVGIIGSETDYEGNYEYVLYTLDNILNYKQLTTAGSSTAPCGTSDWGGDWGASIQQFRINR